MLVTTGVDVAEQGMDYQGDEAGNGTPAGIEQGMEHQGNGSGNGTPGGWSREWSTRVSMHWSVTRHAGWGPVSLKNESVKLLSHLLIHF